MAARPIGSGAGRAKRRFARAAGVLAMLGALLASSGCGLSIPADPGGALDRIQGDVLRVGASAEHGLISFGGDPADRDDVDGDRVEGPLADLMHDFAALHDAEVVWSAGSEESLVRALEEGRIDIAVGGMTSDTPWAERTGTTRGYTEIPGAEGREIVLLVPKGENGLLSALERFLDEEML